MADCAAEVPLVDAIELVRGGEELARPYGVEMPVQLVRHFVKSAYEHVPAGEIPKVIHGQDVVVVRSLFSAGFPLGVHGVYYTPPSRVGQGGLGLFVEKVSLFAEDENK